MKIILGLFVCFLSCGVHAETLKKASPESLARATKQMTALSKAMSEGMEVLKLGNLNGIGAHSRRMNTLVEDGQKQFGSSIFEPLGRCFGAGVNARAWWAAQVSAAQNGGIERIPGSIKDALGEYQMNRAECLKSADPIAVEESNAQLDAELMKKFGGGRECLTVLDVDPETKEIISKPKPAHCKN